MKNIYGIDYEKPGLAVKKGEFIFAAAMLCHNHIYPMCKELIAAGGVLKSIFDSDEENIAEFKKHFPDVNVAKSIDEILDDNEIMLVASAAVTNQRCELGLRVMDAGKDYFTDKAPMTTLEQLEAARKKVSETGRKYMVYYSERLYSESAVFAEKLIANGMIGNVLQVIGIGPHKLGTGRPNWFFDREKYGGILCDIGSHQIEQYLHYCGEDDARIDYSCVKNFNHKEYPEFNDFGEAVLRGKNGTKGYFQVNWFTPDALRSWGDVRTVILGTSGYMELRKNLNITTDDGAENIFLVNNDIVQRIDVKGKIGFPFFGNLIRDCLNRTETAMTQEHCFKAAQLCIEAQLKAEEQSNAF